MSGVRRPRGPRQPRRTNGSGGIYSGVAAEGDDLGAAAEIIAAEARRLAGAWSKTVPDSIEVEVKGNTATVSTGADPAYPNETGSRHPVYARGEDRAKWTWVKGNHRPFLGPAVDAKASEAVDRYAKKIDRLIEKIGSA